MIDPKPLVGEREFRVAPIIRSFELGRGRKDVQRRLDRLTADLGLDRERARLWALAQTVAWSCGSDYLEQHRDTARWLLELAKRIRPLPGTSEGQGRAATIPSVNEASPTART